MQARSQRTRQRLVHAGAEMFNLYGYAHATLEQIAGVAGMTKGALYFHFASKDGLAEAVQEQGRAMLREFVGEHQEAGVPPVQVLIDMTHWLARMLQDDLVIRASFRITNECTGRESPGADFHEVWISEVLRLLGQAREAGALQDRGAENGPETLLSAMVCGIGVLAGTAVRFPRLSDQVPALWAPLLTALVPPGDIARYRTHPPAVAENARPPAATTETVGPPATTVETVRLSATIAKSVRAPAAVTGGVRASAVAAGSPGRATRVLTPEH
ncbi:ScbR family autoregulator-binding transcription factor [Streptomyces sp. NPDC091265]|uniref:ScbR family autoregulator-binding transcription factor n=1 Tax=unclassified Streptomyces TaxID=2593676 RepID=UPI00344C57C2